jgi:hypothetical protein
VGLKSNSSQLFTQAWVDSLKGAPESAMVAEVLITNPNSSTRVYDPDTDEWNDVSTIVYTGKARVQPLRSAAEKAALGNETTVQTVLVSVPIATRTVNFRPGMMLEVLTAALNPSLETYQFVLVEIVDSSNPFERTLMFQLNQETVVI